MRSEASDGVAPACGQEKALSVEDKKFQAVSDVLWSYGINSGGCCVDG